MNYRTSDPESSKIAGQEAERSFAPTQRKGVLEFIKKHPNKTSAELGAFGGSRSGILEAETNRAFADQAARTAAGLRQGGFDRATSLAGQDINREIGNRGFQAGS